MDFVCIVFGVEQSCVLLEGRSWFGIVLFLGSWMYMGFEIWFIVQRIRETGRGRGVFREDKGDFRGRARGGRERVWEGQFIFFQGVREGLGRRKFFKFCFFLSSERFLCEFLVGIIISGIWQRLFLDLIQEFFRRFVLFLFVNIGRGYFIYVVVGRGWRKLFCYLQRGFYVSILIFGILFRFLVLGRMMSFFLKESFVVGDITVLKFVQCCLIFVFGFWRRGGCWSWLCCLQVVTKGFCSWGSEGFQVQYLVQFYYQETSLSVLVIECLLYKDRCFFNISCWVF